ncbi:MAG: YhcN/YlaJ family sporulation lipoprotein [Candidatus Cohnella colombiensis]|uniref:YhcN/YlaJ family sporulation lipoprotein n=1 Tax=Candidatus Cohnella colombiensis TaxID=3121368 RepID=A0AA95EWM3_9BACL|nr:MAG: YhcN/YlaJ family sporulation lipoprotein [Cohnella sp.]
MYIYRKMALALLTILLGLITGCNYKDHYQNSNQDYASRASNDPKMMGVRSYGSTNAHPNQHNNRYFEYSSAISTKVASLPGINSAIVFLTDKNAYVGIVMDATATGTKARGGANTREQHSGGSIMGRYDVANESPVEENRKMITPYTPYISQKDSVNISTELRQVIGERVRMAHPRVNEVHISANQEYVNQSFEFVKAIWSGDSNTALIPEFNVLVQYFFGYGDQIPLPLYETQSTRANTSSPSLNGEEALRRSYRQ